MKRAKNLVLVIVIAALMLAMGTGAMAATDKGYVYVTVEGMTIGHGYLEAPKKVAFTQGDTVEDVVLGLLGEGNYTLNEEYGYLTGIGIVQSDIEIPQYILDAMAESGEEPYDTVTREGFLSEMDYFGESGWMIMMNNASITDSMGNIAVEDGDVIRVCFSLYHYGADVGLGSEEWGTPNLIEFANFDALIAKMARIAYAAPAGYADRADFTQAIAVLENLTSTDQEVVAAFENLAVYDASSLTDVAGHWAEDQITKVMKAGLFQGNTATAFEPEAGMTRAMFVTALSRLANANLADYEMEATVTFTDVANGEWYAGAVRWAADHNIVNGVGEGLFAPDAQITREQMAKMLVDYAAFAGTALPSTNPALTFTDDDQISAWAKDGDYVGLCQRAGIINGYDDGSGNFSFRPLNTATRAEVATIFANYIESFDLVI